MLLLWATAGLHRRMFPAFTVAVRGLEMDQKYLMEFHCNPSDNKRYKYVNSNWAQAGKAESHAEDLLRYIHPDSPAKGSTWVHNKICFKKVKLTNNKAARKGQVSKNY